VQKIATLDSDQLVAIVEIIQKFENVAEGEEIEIDLENLSPKTLHSLQEYIHNGTVPGTQV
jgi:hypothetical protein